MSEATIYSQTRCAVFAKPVTRVEAEGILKEFLLFLGGPLSYNRVILGHIKVLARIADEDEYLFLSLTVLDRVDIKRSPNWHRGDDAKIISIEVKINVLVFGYSSTTVEKVIDVSLQRLGLGGSAACPDGQWSSPSKIR